MRRVFKISDIAAARSELQYFHHRFYLSKRLTDPTTIPDPKPTSARWFSTEESESSSKPIMDLYAQFANKWVYAEVRAKEALIEQVSVFRDELMKNVKDETSFETFLEVEGWNLFKMYSDGAALLELLRLLEESSPSLAIKVFNWRRRRGDNRRPISSEEYVKGIKIAGRMKNVDLAVEIFMEAATNRIKNVSTYNALMGAYMYNGLSEKCQSVYRDLRQDINCCPTSVTFNMLISLFGQRVLTDQMESVFQEMKDLNISPDLNTYNNMIAGYLTAWMWDSMENTYHTMMETGSVYPDLSTHLLMLRGYAHSGNLEKMEEIYEMVGSHVREKHISLIRAMICAYCSSSYTHRVKRIEELMRLIPENEYRPWLNVLLIRVYAEENLVDEMDRSIDEAFEHNTSVNTVKIMRCIAGSYFRNNAVERLAKFIKRAEDSGWRIYRSLYHGLMVMLSSEKRLQEMEQVVIEMEKFNYGYSKRTLYILYKAYSEQEEGYRHKFHRVLGLMCKHGYGVPS
ncbi:pentatricopeptide repeat-containing protein At2g30780-like [Cynara cardunculus var. scolymus]|uniref:Pentatricopeptide repeat-containing protein n=1 Tax=Cynara cardunculus var. scolymus TaxID=59895 RepID=A0A124SDB9_CYNCS|nr:pentatricopeptide repeat-containing protein At2g30780-like [Cynara cardunculus var. scolymus]XP_024994990.1 pentatricopeptide repeat-containing protein At2g30780-like [Cynara cardunculus var. scolymus]XP_024994991.1 pentatricopeptide repeat-containing protein At2g30780-like [Cynara cardunculus var. scolymus]KVH96416.1 Pentatricopeptide repeat-containing protein [Cynara cardunculus var. scolymus]